MTILEYAIIYDLPIGEVVDKFIAQTISSDVGVVDAEKDLTFLHWLVRQGINPRTDALTKKIRKRWPFSAQLPAAPQGPQGIRLDLPKTNGLAWWDDPAALLVVNLRQQAIEQALVQFKKRFDEVTRLKSLYSYVRRMQDDLNKLLDEVQDVTSLTHRTLAASNMDELRAMCFPQEYIEKMIAEKMKEMPPPPKVKIARQKKRRYFPQCIYCDKPYRDIEGVMLHQERCWKKPTKEQQCA